MRHAPIKVLLAVAAVATLAGGCATRLEVGPGYYHYDSRLSSVEVAPAAVVTEPVVVYREPPVTRYYRY
jgi:hypothetical protein